jgi:hypothetical protein
MTRSNRHLGWALFAGLAVVLVLAGESRAEWGRYRAVTSYSFPSVPVYQPGVVVQSTYRPVFVAPAYAAPVVSQPIAVTPPIIISQPQTAYYAPAPVTTYYAPAAVGQTIVARPAYFPRARAVYQFTPARAVPAVIVP